MSSPWGSCDTEPYLVVAEVRDRLSVSKYYLENFIASYSDPFELKKLNNVKVKKNSIRSTSLDWQSTRI
jgi:hypothetical protein